MSAKQWFVLLCLFIAYLLVGAAVFWYIEQALELEKRNVIIKERVQIYGLLYNNCRSDSEEVPKELLDGLSHYCQRPVYNYSIGEVEPKMNWHFYNAVFFVLTVVSTIGYGNLSPTCPLSRNIMIVYALVGIPINGILLKHMADFFGNFFYRAHDRYKKHRHEGRAGLISDILLYLIPGLVVFIIFPAAIFVIFEKWTFGEGIYFAFVTLTTIGFGDLVAGQTDESHSAWYVTYKIFLILWVIFGLGYLVMLLGFITGALRSKRMTRLEHKLAHQIKQTPTKLWQGLVQETRFLRRALNELYLLKLKPVYRESGPERYPHLCRSSSAPELYHLPSNVPNEGTFGRPRALSEVLHIRGLHVYPAPLRRPRSESELSLIDRRATFADTGGFAELDPAELLHEFMSALVPDEPFLGWRPAAPPAYATKAGTPMPDGGIMGFSDHDIMADERPKMKARERAASLAPRMIHADEEQQEQWTWSGAAASKRIQDLLRTRNLRRQSVTTARQLQELQQFQQQQQLRSQHKQLQKEKKRRRCQSSSAAEDTGSGQTFSLTNNNGFFAMPPGPKSSKWSQPSQGLPGRGIRRSSLFTPTQRMNRQFGSRQSVDDIFDPWDHWSPGLSPSKPSSRRISAANMGRSNETAPSVLETTSLADFLRVLQSVRAQAAAAAATVPSPPAPAPPQQRTKSRKLGTAYLQPLYPEVYEDAEKVSRPRSASSSGAEPPRRKFSIWPSVFSSSQTVLPSKQDKHRRLSSLFADPPKKRRFSIWPSFGGKPPADVEAAVTTTAPSPTDATTQTSPPPKITVSYVSESPYESGPEINPSAPGGVSWGTGTPSPGAGNGNSGPVLPVPGIVPGSGASSPSIAISVPVSLSSGTGVVQGSLRRQALTQQHRLSLIPATTSSTRRPSPPAGFVGSLDSSALFRRRSNSDLPAKPSRRH